MSPRRVNLLFPSLLAVLLLGSAGCNRKDVSDGEAQRIADLRRTHEILHDSLEALVAGDTLLAQAASDSGEVVLAVREVVVESLIHEVTRRYLDRVELDISPEVQVEEGGEIRVKVLVGNVKVGAWKVHLTIHRIRGTLRAQPPKVSVTGTNRLHLDIPVTLQEGRGDATIQFTWDAAGVASVACRDFQVTQRIAGTVVPRTYGIDGDFVLSSGKATVVAQPEFPEEKFRLSADLSRESWREVQRLLESQDKIGKCGIALNPPAVIEKLRALGSKGFDIKLPRSILRTVELPASVSEAVTVEGNRIELSVRPSVLRITPRTFWYSAAVETRIRRGPAGGPGEVGPSGAGDVGPGGGDSVGGPPDTLRRAAAGGPSAPPSRPAS
ncbi:MAG: hypothetical protein H0V09_00480 [Gemmatimonadetes bacterium]|nr:hypothetical protein [Gemmatimonadota bacterium]